MKACSESNLDSEEVIELPCTICPLIYQFYLPCQHYLWPFAILKEPIPLSLIHPRWYIDNPSWDPTSHWKIPTSPFEELFARPRVPTIVFSGTIAPSGPDLLISDHRGEQQFVKTAYKVEQYLAQQPAHISAQIAREFQEATTALRRKWSETQVGFHTAILPTSPVSFRTQFWTSAGRVSSIDPRQGLRRGPTKAKLAESELQCQQTIDYVNQVAENETQDVTVVQKPTWIIVHNMVDV